MTNQPTTAAQMEVYFLVRILLFVCFVLRLESLALVPYLSSPHHSTTRSAIHPRRRKTVASSSDRFTRTVLLWERPYGDENFFLHQVETTIDTVLHTFPADVAILELPASQRESLGVARRLDQRLKALRRNNDCPRCWMQRKHCICTACPAVEVEDPQHRPGMGYASLNRIFLVMHHKEIGLKLDTAKLILSSFPSKCRLIVAGIDADYQDSMKELQEALLNEQHQHSNNRPTSTCLLLLFPDESAKTLDEIVASAAITANHSSSDAVRATTTQHEKYDLIVLDGTWAQARKFVSKYFSGSQTSVQSVKLGKSAVEILETDGSIELGHQHRRHCTSWRQVGTFEATRLFLRDWEQVFGGSDETRKDDLRPVWERIKTYQQIANDAALRELGPPRIRSNNNSLEPTARPPLPA